MSDIPENPAPPAPPSDAPPPPPPEPAASAPPPPPPESSGSADSNRTLMLVLSYLGVFALIPFFVEKEDQEVRWHAKHGLVLFGMWIAIGIVFAILTNIPALGCLFAIISIFIPIIGLIVHIVCIVKALKGERFIIPGISPLADSF